MTVPENPNTVHGRLLESLHVTGYTFERACAELEYLLDDDRWKSIGGGFTDINKFLATLDFSDLRIAIDQRKRLTKRIAEIDSRSQRATARLLGVDESTVRADLGKRAAGNPAMSERIATIPERNELTSDINAGNPAPSWFQADADPSHEAKRITRNAERVAARDAMRTTLPATALPTDRYRLMLADPPWQYEHVKTESRAIENQYPTMTLDAICALDVPAADDCVLFLWATSPKLAEALRVLDAWRFVYRSDAVWDKLVMGMGYYFRQQHELLLVATRGSMRVPEPDARPASVIRERRGKHSEKPAIVYSYIEGMYPEITDRIELFARAPRDGWARWGNQS